MTIGLDQVDAAALSKGKTGGKLDGTVEIREGVPSGAVRVRGVPTPVGDADADLTLALTDVGFVETRAKAQIGAVGAATLGARLAIPDHPFDPAAWKALGTRVVDRATAEATGVVVDPKLLSAFHVITPYRGTASVRLELGAGATSAKIVADVANITGGPLARGIDVHLEGSADATGTRGVLRVGAGSTTLAAASYSDPDSSWQAARARSRAASVGRRDMVTSGRGAARRRSWRLRARGASGLGARGRSASAARMARRGRS